MKLTPKTKDCDVVGLQAQLERLDRTRFVELLAKVASHSPSDNAIGRIAETEPDKFFKMILDAQKAAGFAERHEHDIVGHIAVTHMSMSQLEDELRRMGLDPSKLAGGGNEPAIEASEASEAKASKDA